MPDLISCVWFLRFYNRRFRHCSSMKLKNENSIINWRSSQISKIPIRQLSTSLNPKIIQTDIHFLEKQIHIKNILNFSYKISFHFFRGLQFFKAFFNFFCKLWYSTQDWYRKWKDVWEFWNLKTCHNLKLIAVLYWYYRRVSWK